MSERERDPEARIIYLLLVVLSLPVLVVVRIQRQPIGPGATICMVLCALGALGLIVERRRRTALPKARVVKEGELARAPLAPRDDRVLIVEDDREIRKFLVTTFGTAGIAVVEAATLADAATAIGNRLPSAIVLDLGLPDGDGIDWLRQLRTHSSIPVVVISARDGAPVREQAFTAGADDFVMKPFLPGELRARVQALLVRGDGAARLAQIMAGPFAVDLARGTASLHARPLALSPAELRVLAHLAAHADTVCTYPQLVIAAWGSDAGHDAQAVRVLVAGLRRKLEADPARPVWLITEIGVGYRLRTQTAAGSSSVG